MNPEQETEVQPTELADVQSEVSEPESAGGALTGAHLSLKRGGEEPGITFPLGGAMVVGRFDPSVGPIDIDLGSIPEGSYVSRRHARIVHQDGGFLISDLGSSNGTFILRPGDDDFHRVEGSELLVDGDEIAFGNARFIFRIS
jgi:hypothetical protein